MGALRREKSVSLVGARSSVLLISLGFFWPIGRVLGVTVYGTVSLLFALFSFGSQFLTTSCRFCYVMLDCFALSGVSFTIQILVGFIGYRFLGPWCAGSFEPTLATDCPWETSTWWW